MDFAAYLIKWKWMVLLQSAVLRQLYAPCKKIDTNTHVPAHVRVHKNPSVPSLSHFVPDQGLNS